MNGLVKLIKSNRLVQLVIVIAIVGGIYYYMKNKEALENIEEEPKVPEPENVEEEAAKAEETKINELVAGKDQVKAEDLLPQYDDANEFAKENPVSKLLKEQNFLVSGYHVGVNTVMQSNKIPYHDIRSLPPIPKESVGPFLESSYEQSPAQMRRFFEIGA
jgi:predicted RND superfamily exporter protein